MAPKGYIAGIFGRSPIAPLQQHMGRAAECARCLVPFVQAVLGGDREAVLAQRAEIERLEDEADDLKQQIRLHLPNSLFMPVARTDLLEILRVQDRIANRAKDISGLMVGRRMVLPGGFGPGFLAFVESTVEVVDAAERIINELDELYETGFGGKEAELVESMVESLSKLEKDSDRIQIELRATLFEQEAELPPVDVMFYYRITDLVGDLSDVALRVGSRLLILLAK